ncbi:MAG TPA: NUDIX hydrolase [Steroidobacteraceae bacterium]|nr:NUDIX hydrolase [Steroidobacteraceae bacterium]
MNPTSRRIYTGRVVTLDLAEVRLPNGQVAELEIVGHPGGAAVVAVNARNEVCLLRHYRHVAGGWLWEVPAGKLDGKPPSETARSELREEAGLAAARWETLGRVVSSPGVFTEVVHLYLARDLTAVPAAPEFDEVFEIAWVPLAAAVGRALEGDIEDAKSVVALVRAARRLGVTA